MKNSRFTATIKKDNNIYVAISPEFDVASQGVSKEEAKDNLKEFVELFLEYVDNTEIPQRFHKELYIPQFEVA